MNDIPNEIMQIVIIEAVQKIESFVDLLNLILVNKFFHRVVTDIIDQFKISYAKMSKLSVKNYELGIIDKTMMTITSINDYLDITEEIQNVYMYLNNCPYIKKIYDDCMIRYFTVFYCKYTRDMDYRLIDIFNITTSDHTINDYLVGLSDDIEHKRIFYRDKYYDYQRSHHQNDKQYKILLDDIKKDVHTSTKRYFLVCYQLFDDNEFINYAANWIKTKLDFNVYILKTFEEYTNAYEEELINSYHANKYNTYAPMINGDFN